MRVATDHREAILAAAAKLFGHKPFHEVLMDDVAEKTGIAKGTIYRYFPNKEELFAALALHHLDVLASEAGAAADADLPPLERLERIIARIAEVIREHNDFFQVMQRHECGLIAKRSAELLERRAAMRDHIARAIDAAAAKGLLELPFSASLAADMLMGMLRNVLRFAKPQPEPAETARMCLHIFVNGLVKKPGGPQ